MAYKNNSVSRISVSLPEDLLAQLDGMLYEQGFENRSQALAGMIRQQLVEYKRYNTEEIMTGTITLLYDHSVPGLHKNLSDLQHQFITEVISSLHVQLMHSHTMEIIVVQGPARRLQEIADRAVSMRGVMSGKLNLSTVLIPQVHPLPEENSKRTEDLYAS